MEPEQIANSKQKVDPQALRDTLRFWATGVSIVSAANDGDRHGMTVNSFSSLSLEPPLVLVSLGKNTRTHSLVSQAGAYGVTILSRDQQEISDRFAGYETEYSDRFEGLETLELETGSPFVAGGLAFVDCRVVSQHDAGTHTLFIAEVQALAAPAADLDDRVDPLLYFNRAYRKLDE